MELQTAAEFMRETAEKLEGIAWLGTAAGVLLLAKMIREVRSRKGLHTRGKSRKLLWLAVVGIAGICENVTGQKVWAEEDVQGTAGMVVIESLEPSESFCRESLTVRIKGRDNLSGIKRIQLKKNGVIIVEENLDGSIREWEKIVSMPSGGDGEIYLTGEMESAAGKVISTGRSWIADQTAPELSVLWEGKRRGGYFISEGTLCLAVTEKNFRPELWEISWIENPGKKGAIAWSEERGGHICRIPFREDGQYELQIRGKDPVGNLLKTDGGKGVTAVRWTVDKQAPEVSIQGIRDGEHYNQEVKLKIHMSDVWLDKERCSYTLTGEKKGEISLGDVDEDGNITWCAGMDQDWDDCYQLVVMAADLAGNFTEKRIKFTVNRKGSIYSVQGLEKKNVYSDAPDLVLEEKNLSKVKKHAILCIWEGESEILKEGEDYQVQEEVKDHCYDRKYSLHKEVFRREGEYTVQILSEDQAGNKTGNMNYHGNSLPLTFYVDSIPPTAVISGVEEDRSYQERELPIQIRFLENQKLKKVSIWKNGEKIPVKGEKALEEPLVITYGEKRGWQTLQVEAEDEAGNQMQRRQYRFYLEKKSETEKLREDEEKEEGWGKVLMLAGMLGGAGLTIRKYLIK